MTVQVATDMRNGSISQLVEMLQRQNDVKFDAVVPAAALSFHDGMLHIENAAVRQVSIDPEGNLSEVKAPAILAPTSVFDAQAAGRLGIPLAYVRTLRGRSDVIVDCRDVAGWDENDEAGEAENETPWFPQMSLLDANVNAWLDEAARRNKTFLVRAFWDQDPDTVGIARSLLSNRFGFTDNYDVILAVLEAIREAGINTSSLDVLCDLGERNMRVRVNAPQIGVDASEMLRNYRDPRTGRYGRDYPIVNAGIVLGNSETGGGAFFGAPRITWQVCTNGQTRTVDGFREVHLGSTLPEQTIIWSEATHEANLELIKAKTRDAVTTWMSAKYVDEVLHGMRENYDAPIENAAATIERVAKTHKFTDDEAASILDMFIKGGELTAGGVMQAVTAAAQEVADPDRAAEYEDMAFDVLATAAGR